MTQRRFLMIDARFYTDLADELVAGAKAALNQAHAAYDWFSVPGVLEIPAALSMALISASNKSMPTYDGFIALGCVIRGETSHYDIVAGESARALMDLSVQYGLALGNGILTVENQEQAWARAHRKEKDKGGAAARAAIQMAELKTHFYEIG